MYPDMSKKATKLRWLSYLPRFDVSSSHPSIKIRNRHFWASQIYRMIKKRSSQTRTATTYNVYNKGSITSNMTGIKVKWELLLGLTWILLLIPVNRPKCLASRVADYATRCEVFCADRPASTSERSQIWRDYHHIWQHLSILNVHWSSFTYLSSTKMLFFSGR